MPTICIYCSSSDAIDLKWRRVAQGIADALIAREFDLVWGCGAVGLMGEVGRHFKNAGRKTTGVIPGKLNLSGIVFPDATECILTDTMSERKQIMIERADAFLALPGGFGTLEEIMEVITLCQLGYIHKPVALCNSGGFYEGLLAQFERMLREKFIRNSFRRLYLISDDPQEIAAYLSNSKPAQFSQKWFEDCLDGRAEVPE